MRFLLQGAPKFTSFSQQQETELPYSIDYLRSHRCLIILDDVQTIFSSQQLAGNYRSVYENYAAFFKQIAESCHNSCLILFSWEKSREIAALESQPKSCQHCNSIVEEKQPEKSSQKKAWQNQKNGQNRSIFTKAIPCG